MGVKEIRSRGLVRVSTTDPEDPADKKPIEEGKMRQIDRREVENLSDPGTKNRSCVALRAGETDLGHRLREETWNKVAALLVKEGAQGLYTTEQLQLIKEDLLRLSEWLLVHKPERIQRADLEHDKRERFTSEQVLCIAYPDHVKQEQSADLQTLTKLFNEHLASLYSHVHILPHFASPVIHPELSGPARRADGGFEASSYQMDPSYGRPEDLQALSANLMFDFVLNHLSVESEWFQRFMADEPDYRDFFLTAPKEIDLTSVFRPRRHHPVVEHEQDGLKKNVWCTFSETQADLNFDNPRVFSRVLTAMIQDFIGQGANWVRLDAVGFLVKRFEEASSCFGEQETHNLIKAMNLILSDLCPSSTLIAEVNATKDVIETYYGDGDEAHMAYEFPVAPLSLFTTYTGNATPLIAWARERAQHPDRIGLAFTASHDGIGVLPMKDCPIQNGLEILVEETKRRGAGINYRAQIVAKEVQKNPYEICITWAQAILTPEEQKGMDALSDEAIGRIADRFIASQSYAYVAPHCVPADYLGAIALLLNDEATFEATDHNRNKNRGQIDLVAFEKALRRPETSREKLLHRVFSKKAALIEARKGSEAFSPYARCEVGVVEETDQNPIFSVLRTKENHRALALTNSSSTKQQARIALSRLGIASGAELKDLITKQKREYRVEGDRLVLDLDPNEVVWLEL